MRYLLALAILILAGCSDPTDFATQPVTNKSGQTITFVDADKLHGWLTEHQNIRIVTMTGYGAGTKTYGGYVIVYENIPVPAEAPK